MSHFKKFLADRGALKFNETTDVVNMTLTADKEQEEDSVFLITADALSEAGYEETANYVRFCIKEYEATRHEDYLAKSFEEIKNKALENGLEVSSVAKPIDNSIIFYNLKNKKVILPQPIGTVENYMIVIKHNIKIHLLLVDLVTNDYTSTTSSRSVDFKQFLESVDWGKRCLFCAAGMFLTARNHAGTSSGERITKDLTAAVQTLASFNPGRRINNNAIMFLSGMTHQVSYAFNQIAFHYPEKKKEAAQIIKKGLMSTRWRNCLNGRAVNMPMHCANFLRIQEILEQNP